MHSVRDPRLGCKLEQEEIRKYGSGEQDPPPTEIRLQCLLDYGPAVVYLANPSGDYRVIFVSGNVERIFGYRPEDFVNIPNFFIDHIHPEDTVQVWRKIAELFQNGHCRVEFRFLHGDGRYRWTRDELKLVRDSNDNPTEMVGVWLDITREKEAEAGARDARSRSCAAFQASPCMMSIYSLKERRYVEINDEFSRITGYTRDEIGAGKGIGIIYEPEDRLRLREGLRKTGIVRDLEAAIRTKSGELRYALVSAEVIHVDGEPYVLGAMVDITEKKKAEEALRISETRLSLIHDTANDLLFLVRVEPGEVYRVITVSRSYVETTGIKEEDVVGKTSEEVLTGAHARYVIGKYRKALRLRRTIRYEETIETVEGTKYCETTLTPIVDEKGEFTYLLGVIHDITERKLAEEALRRSEERFRKAFHSSPDMMAMVTFDDERFVDINNSALDVSGYSRAEVVGRTTQDLGFWARPEDAGKIRAALLAEGRARNLEMQFRTKSGEVRLGVLSAELIEVDGRQCVLGTMRDITDQKRMESEWVRLDRLNLVGEMAAGIAHEIRNPMTSVRGFLQILQEKPEYSSHRSFFDLMIDELDRANGIITEFLSLAKGKSIELKSRNLRRSVEALLPLLAADAIKSDKYVGAELSDVPKVLYDEKEIRQLVLNLAKNGLEAMSPGGRLTIKVAPEDGHILLSVRDEGGGIRPDLVDRLGTPFLTTKDQGTGLGLAVCYRIAQRHDAAVKVDTGPEGTTFLVRFKIDQPAM